MHRVPVPSAFTRLHCSTITASLLCGCVFCHTPFATLQSKLIQPHRLAFTAGAKSGVWPRAISGPQGVAGVVDKLSAHAGSHCGGGQGTPLHEFSAKKP